MKGRNSPRAGGRASALGLHSSRAARPPGRPRRWKEVTHLRHPAASALKGLGGIIATYHSFLLNSLEEWTIFFLRFFFFLKVLETNDLQYWASLVVLGRYWASPVAQLVKNQPAIQETWVQSLRWEDPLEKGKATHSSILAWRIPWTV